MKPALKIAAHPDAPNVAHTFIAQAKLRLAEIDKKLSEVDALTLERDRIKKLIEAMDA